MWLLEFVFVCIREGWPVSVSSRSFLFYYNNVDGPNKIDVNKEKATGKAAVEEVVRRIEESGIFPSTHGLLRRIAWVESMDGKHPNTFRDPSAKAGVGIWQMDKGTFNDLKMQTTLYDLFRKVKKRFGIDFRTIERKELSRPLVSALAARIQLYRFKEKIPLDITQQAKYWKKYYNTKKGSGTVEKFLGDMKTLPKTKTLDEGTEQERVACIVWSMNILPGFRLSTWIQGS